MQDSILKLYRSALNVGAEWSRTSRALRPTLIFWGETDAPAPIAVGERMSQAIGAPLLPLPCGQFTPVKRPDEVARTISDQRRAAGGG